MFYNSKYLHFTFIHKLNQCTTALMCTSAFNRILLSITNCILDYASVIMLNVIITFLNVEIRHFLQCQINFLF